MKSFIKSRDSPGAMEAKKITFTRGGKSMNILKKSFSVFISVWLIVSSFLLVAPMGAISAAAAEANSENTFKGNVTVDLTTWYKNTPRFFSTLSSGYKTDAFCIEPAKAPPFTDSMTFGGKYVSPVTNEIVLNVLYYGYNAPGFNLQSSAFNTGNNSFAKTSKGAMLFFRNRDNLAAGLDEDAFLYTFTHYALSYAMYGADTAFGVNPGYDEYTYKNAVTSYVAAITNGVKAGTLPNRKPFLRAYMINYGSGSQNIIFPVYRMRLEFDKASTNPAFTKNNNLYSFDTAQFVVFKNNKNAADIARTKEQNTNDRKAGAITKGGAISYIYTDSTGKGFFKNFGYGADNTDYAIVDIDNYYVIEYRSPNGYALNNDYYGFTDSGEVDDNGLPIYRISSSLKAANGKPAFPNEPRLELRIQKRSANTSITDGNKCYSLKNAEYGIYDSKADAENNTNLRGVIVTDENGKGTYSNSQGSSIPAKDFWGKELKASNAYALDTEPHHFLYAGLYNSEGFPVYSFDSVEPPLSDPITVLLQKYDKKTGKGSNQEKLANAEFTVNFYPDYYSSVDEIGETQPLRSWVLKTDEDGYLEYSSEYLVSGDELWYQKIGGVDLPTIPYGTITVQETKAPDGYLINPEVFLANIDDSGGNISWRTTNENVDESVLLFPETPVPTKTYISKTDITGKKEVVGAKLNVSNTQGKTVDEWTSTNEPHYIEGLERGMTYTLTEKIPADGYATANKITFTVNEDGSPTYVTMKDDTIKYEFVKVNDEGKRIANAQLSVRDSNRKIVEQWVTDGKTNHQIIGKLIVGQKYFLTEDRAPDGYLKAEDVVFTVKDTPELQTITMTDMPTTTRILKVDENGAPVVGAKLELYESKGQLVLAWTTDGTAKEIKWLAADKEYVLREAQAPDGYATASEIRFKVKTDGSVTTVRMVEPKIEMRFSKVNEKGQRIAGAQLQILNANNGAVVVPTWTSSAVSDYVVKGKLVAGQEYRLHEVKAPDGYSLAEDITFRVEDTAKPVTIKMTDLPTGVFIDKVSNGQPVIGAKLRLTDTTGKTILEWTSDGNPKEVKGLTVNAEYVLTEIAPPDGYVTASPVTFKVKSGVTYVRMNDPKTVAFFGKREPGSNEFVAGAHLQILDIQTNEVIDDWITESSYHQVSGLLKVNHKYRLHEVEAPKGYAFAEDLEFTMEDNTRVDFYDMYEPTTTTYVSKKALTGNDEIPGALLSITDSEGRVVAEWTSTTRSKIIRGLAIGETYTLTERIPANGYTTAESITFQIHERGYATEVTMRDAPTFIRIMKVDEENNPLSGVQLQVLDDSGNVVVPTWTTDGTPYDITGKLIVNQTYYLHEVKTIKGYDLAPDVKFTVKDTPDVQTVTMVNKATLGSLTIHKTDGYGRALTGAEWKITDENGKRLRFVANPDGSYSYDSAGSVRVIKSNTSSVTVDKLPVGLYYVTETKAPNGKTPYSEKIPVRISADNTSTLNADITVKDNNIVMYNTGSIGVVPLYCAGAISLVAAIAIVFAYKRKNSKKNAGNGV